MSRYLMSFGAAALILTLSGPAFAGTHVASYSAGRSFTYGSHINGPSYITHGNPYNFVSHGTSYNYVSNVGISRNFITTNAYHLNYGRPFSNGFYYAGPYHNQWTYCTWYGRYGCNCYWCPSTLCWYYWCATQNCYYPISYIGIAAPGAIGAPAVAGLAGLPTPPVGFKLPAGPLLP